MSKYKSLAYILVLSVFTIYSAYCQPQSKLIDQIVAVVGNDIILQSDIESQYLQMKAQGYYSNNDIKCEILEQLLYQKLLLNQAKLDSLEVTDNQIESTLDTRIRYFVSQAGSEEELEKYFNKPIVKLKDELRKYISEQLLTQKMQQKITENIKITPSDIRTYFDKIPNDSIPTINAEYQVGQIVLYPKVTEAEKLQVKEKLQEYRERIQNGKIKFSALAVLYSEDTESAKNGGELGYKGRNDFVPEFSAAAFSLKEKDEISKIVETEFGYHIIQLIDRKGEKANVRHILISPKPSILAENEAVNKLDSIASVIRKGKIKFEEAAVKYSQDESTKTNGGIMVNENTGSSKFDINDFDKVSINKIKNLKISEISDPVKGVDEKGKSYYKIFFLKYKSEPHKLNLKDDYQKLQDLALADKKQKSVDQWSESKIKTTYIHIDDSYKNCKFNNKLWLK